MFLPKARALGDAITEKKNNRAAVSLGYKTSSVQQALSKTRQARRKPLKTQIFKACRWLHIYCSSALCVLLIFFCVTGITLNHRWYGPSGEIITESLTVTQQQLSRWGIANLDSWHPKVDAISQYLQTSKNFPTPKSVELDAEYGEILFEFALPASLVTAFVQSGESHIELEIEQGSTLSLINDLHKGRYTGEVWSTLIDLSALLMLVFALSGVIILFQGKKHRRAGLASTLAGLATPLVIYFCFVPAA